MLAGFGMADERAGAQPDDADARLAVHLGQRPADPGLREIIGHRRGGEFRAQRLGAVHGCAVQQRDIAGAGPGGHGVDTEKAALALARQAGFQLDGPAQCRHQAGQRHREGPAPALQHQRQYTSRADAGHAGPRPGLAAIQANAAQPRRRRPAEQGDQRQ